MPKIEKLYTLEITPERFVEACSDSELYELYLLIDSEVLRRENATKFNSNIKARK